MFVLFCFDALHLKQCNYQVSKELVHDYIIRIYSCQTNINNSQ